MSYKLLRNLLFQLEPESAHKFTLNSLSWLNTCKLLPLFIKKTHKPCKIFGLNFANKVGLAAGFDRNIEYVNALSALGFGFIEVGTITPDPQAGNPAPRIFRLKQDNALINRFAFANKGMDYAIRRLENLHYDGILGINIGKNTTTPNDKAIDDYLLLFKNLWQFASYITINISSPNSKGLRDLQQADYLTQLIQVLKLEQSMIAHTQHKYVPLVIKISPDVDDEQLETMAEIFLSKSIDGVIATNTTVSRNNLRDHKNAKEQGGLSGQPLQNLSTHVIRKLSQLLQDKIPIIASGGVINAASAEEKLHAGAKAVQLYTGFIYAGTSLIHQVAKL